MEEHLRITLFSIPVTPSAECDCRTSSRRIKTNPRISLDDSLLHLLLWEAGDSCSTEELTYEMNFRNSVATYLVRGMLGAFPAKYKTANILRSNVSSRPLYSYYFSR